jgi:multidrug transporter EmrE-like cation transporter
VGRREASIQLARRAAAWFIVGTGRIWWNWQTRYFEVVVPQGVQVQVLLCAPILMRPFFHAIAVFAVSIISLSVGNILLKMGMDRFGALTGSGIPVFQALVKSPQLPLGVVLMMVQFIGTITLFKWGWDASVVVPVMGLCYVGTAIMGKCLLGEPVNALRWLGILLIILGVFCIARSVTQAKAP